MLVYFLLGIKIIFLLCSIYLKRMENMNKETGIKSMYCFVQVQFGLRNRDICYSNITKYWGKLM